MSLSCICFLYLGHPVSHTFQLCVITKLIVVSLVWTLKPEVVPGSRPSGCQYSMRLDQLHMAYLNRSESGANTPLPVLRPNG